jgi:hypothetical protein
MAEWPTVEELAQVLNVENVTDWGETLDRILESAIVKVKLDVGDWDDGSGGDEPDESLAQAALRMAELMALRPEAAAGVGMSDPTYQRLLYGHRRTFGVA